MGATRLHTLTKEHIPLILPIVREGEPFGGQVTLDQLRLRLAGCEGWILVKDEITIGAIILSNFHPLHSLQVNAVVDRRYHGRWANLTILRHMFWYVFMELELQKLYSFAIPYHTYPAARMLTDLGFQIEGVDRKGVVAPDGAVYDVVKYGMLKEECVWIRSDQEIRGWLKARKGRAQ